jgi:hypothetical protein
MRRISLLAILVGGAVSYMAPAVLGIIIGMGAGIWIGAAHPSHTPTQLDIILNPYFYYGILAAQVLFGALGGYLAGVTARHDEALNGLLSSSLVVFISAGFHALDPHPLSIRVLKIVVIVIASALGGYLRTVVVRHQASRTNPAQLPLH